MGDDLNFAQRFTRTAADGLSLLTEMNNPRAASDAPVVINMMTTLQKGAKRLRARHIYTGAQDVLTALHHEDDATLNGRIQTLGYLVTEYARGLNELMPKPIATMPRTNSEKWDMARETLNGILPIAPPQEADMLSRLMRAPVTLETVQPDAVADDAQSEKVTSEVVPYAQLEKERPSSATTSAPLTASVALDAMMRDVVADALSVARSIDRTISLSYDMGDRIVSEDIADDLRQRLSRALSQIIRQALPSGRVGHIDVNLAGEQLHIIAGTTALRVAIDPKNIPAAKPLISPETEQGIRAQLSALMDPVSLHETAS